jgi:hypothetical protein
VQVTRLHVRYNNASFPEDLMFQETADTENFQGRYVLKHAWQGSPQQCEAAKEYFKQLAVRHEQEAKTLADLTGWNVDSVRQKMSTQEQKIYPADDKTVPVNVPVPAPVKSKDAPWWKTLW